MAYCTIISAYIANKWLNESQHFDAPRIRHIRRECLKESGSIVELFEWV